MPCVVILRPDLLRMCFLKFCLGTNAWASGLDEHYVAKAEFDFEGENNDELSFKQGTEIILAPKGKNIRFGSILIFSKIFYGNSQQRI